MRPITAAIIQRCIYAKINLFRDNPNVQIGFAEIFVNCALNLTFMASLRIVGALLLFSIAGALPLTSCEDKPPTPPPQDSADNVTSAQKAFDLLVLGKQFYMKKGLDTAGNDLTPQYADQIYILEKLTYTHGPAKVIVGNDTYTGTWKSNDDYSKLELMVEGRPDFSFFSIPWRVTTKTYTGLTMVPQDALNGGQKTLQLEKKQ